MRLTVFSVLFFCLLGQLACADTREITSDAEARALLDSEYFQESSFAERVSILDNAIDSLPETADPVVWGRLTERKVYTLTTLGDYAFAGQFLSSVEDRLLDIAEGEDFYLPTLASGAFIYSYAGNVEKALEYAERAQKSEAYKTDIVQQFRLTTPLASIYVNVGYAELGSELLIDFYEANKTADVPDQLKFGLVSNISYALNQAGQYEKSIEYLGIVADMISEYERRKELPEVEIKRLRWHYLSNVARNKIDLGQFENLSEIAQTLEQLSNDVASPLLQLRSRYVKAASLFSESQYDEAEALLQILIEDAETINSVDLIIDYQKLNVMLYKKMERYPEAFRALEALQDAKARLDNQQGRSRVQYLNAQLSLQQKNFEIAELRRNNAVSVEKRNRERFTSSVLLACALIFAVLAVLLYLSLRKSKTLAGQLVIREKEAIRAAESKSRFLATMSHEIRTPLNALLGMTQLLQRKNLGPEIEADLSIMSEFGQMLLSIVNDVLDFSKIEAGKMRLSLSGTDITEILRHLSEAWLNKLTEKGLLLEMKIPETLPCVSIDAMRVRQCLNNLVSNAVKFTETGRVSVRVVYMAEQQRLQFEVEDTGIGIPAERIEKLFDAFEQEDDSTVRRFGGTGLGLSIVRMLAELMGGTIRLVSTPGEGTTAILSIYAPLAGPDIPETAQLTNVVPDHNAPDGQPDKRVRILIVDDHAVNRMIISAFLASDSIEITEADSGQAALTLFETDQTFDCILLDNRMPNMDGTTLLSIIRQSDAPLRHIPIIFITADAMEGDREKYLELGANGYVSKPVIREELTEEIRKLIR